MLSLLPSLCHAQHEKIRQIHRHARTQGHQAISLRTTYSYRYEEFHYETFDNTHGIKKTNEVDILTTYGIMKDLDLMVNVPLKYEFSRIGDMIYSWTDDIVLEAKWTFFTYKDFHLAINPQVTLPTGKYKQGEGKGRVTTAINTIITQDVKPFTLTFTGYYRRNENLVGDHLDIWKFYFVPSLHITDYLSINSSVGLERDTNKKNPNYPLHLSGGFDWQINEMLSFLPSAEVVFYEMETDVTVYLGTELQF